VLRQLVYHTGSSGTSMVVAKGATVIL